MHRWSQLFIPTLREAPADAEVASHKLLLRAGYIRQLGAGLYSYLFLGNRAMKKIESIVREEMDRIGQELFLPALNPREAWEASGRWAGMGDNMFRLKDRKGAELCLAMTHEEIVTGIAKSELRSYKQLPQIWYQIQTKFRDEPRPKSGLLRVRQFLMKDAYSFDLDEAGLDVSYQKHDAAYRRIFDRCGLQYVAVDADSGSMGGSQSQEFMVYTEAGEDLIVSCSNPQCGHTSLLHQYSYAANREKAISTRAAVTPLTPINPTDLIHTPGITSISQLSEFLNIDSRHFIRTLAFVAVSQNENGVSEQPVIVFLEGEDELNEAKFFGGIKIEGSFSSASEFRLMRPDEIQEFFGCKPGYLGPTARLHRATLKGKFGQFYYDKALSGRTNMIAGANVPDFHRYIESGDLHPDVGSFYDNFRLVKEGEPCPIDGSPLRLGKAVEIGHIFKLGYKYSKSMGASVLNRDGKETTPIMGSYGIGLERILTAAIETSAAKMSGEAYALPPAIAPFQVVVTVTNVKDATLLAAGERIAADLDAAGFDTLLDDRDERAGVKFKDADLIGIPFRINIGRGAAEGPHEKTVEFVNRLTITTQDIPLGQVVATLTAAA